ncbi:MAG: DUF2752 domain-containing protein, partial [Planctomycetota bacterium]|nr:DUF2752 domain-containing protein [Planctomycetota bacterium]
EIKSAPYSVIVPSFLFGAGFLRRSSCTFKNITGIPCLTCGGTRSLFHLSHLRIKKAFSMNPLVFSGFAVVLIYGLISLISIIIYGSSGITITIPSRLGWIKRTSIILLIGSLLINWAYLIFICKP